MKAHNAANHPPRARAKQFQAKTTQRSASYGRNLNKLGRITSTDELSSEHLHHQPQRPLLNRSRSTDGVSGRRNRSFNKLTALHPLTRTRSHQHVPRVQSKVVIDIHHESSDDEDRRPDNDNDEVEEEEVDAFSDDQQEDGPPKEELPVLQPLSYRAPAQFSHKHNVMEDKDQEPENNTQKETEQPQKKPLINSDELATTTAKMSLNDAPVETKEPSSQDLAQYYQNMILSQSTGLVRQFSDVPPFHNSLVPEDALPNRQDQHNDLQYIHSNDHISGALNMKPMSESHNSLKQFTIQPSTTLGTSEESGSMLSFKAEPAAARRDLQMTSVSSVANRSTPSATPNLSQFLRTGSSNIETRTQQKLWLQRENSLLDLSMVKNNNRSAATPQVRREFERVSREFMNVKRFSNPLSDAVKRVNVSVPKHPHGNTTDIIKTFRTDETQAQLMKLWIQSEHHQPSRPYRQPQQQQQMPYQQTQYQHAQQLPQQQRPSLAQAHSAFGAGMNRTPVAPPTTRAVDRAMNSPENKRLGLATVRIGDDQVQKLT